MTCLGEDNSLRDIELKLLRELVSNSRVSDRELSNVLGVSQPTVSKTRRRLEEEGMIDYTGFPNLVKLGFQIMAVVQGKRDYVKYPENLIQKAKDFVKRHPSVILAADGIGLDYDVISISIHKDYSDYSRFMSEMRSEAGGTMKADSFLIDLSGEGILRFFSLRPFAGQLVKGEH